MDESTITCDDGIIEGYNEKTKMVPTKFLITCRTQNFYTLLAFLLITIASLIAVSIYCYLFDKISSKAFITISLHK